MPYIQFQDRQFPLGPADLTVGAFDGASVRLPGDDPRASAVLKVGTDGTGLIRRGNSDAVVLLNGLQLGLEPSPILHGDKVEVGGHALRYGDDKKGGSTQFISSMDLPEALKSKIGTPRKPTTATGGRLVSLVDGREYPVADSGVTFGREIGCDIVIASTDVSRRHARIAPGEGGYILSDMSTNGVFVNGTRIDKTQVLGRGDVVKIGPEEFRFYADVAKPAPAAASASAASAPPSVPAHEQVPAPVAATPPVPPATTSPTSPMPVPAEATLPPPAAAQPPSYAPSLSNTAFIPKITTPLRPAPPPPPVAPTPVPAPNLPPLELQSAMSAAATVPRAPALPPIAPPPSPKPPPAPAAPPEPARASAGTSGVRASIATLEVTNPGPTKGTKYEIFGPLTNVGRGPHNDIAINDESVSDSHAKILKREGAWWLVDQNSTNGTYVGGRRVQGEQQMVGAPDIRFGGIKMIFRPAASAVEEEGKGTKAIAAYSPEVIKRITTARATAASKQMKESTPTSTPVVADEMQVAKKGCMSVMAFLVALAATGATMIVLLLTARR
ncbi:MAG: FHA domain-containing protein [Gemmatimonadales bacterium]